MNLKTLSSDKSGFRMWNEKFINAFEAAIKGSRIVMEAITQGIDDGSLESDQIDFELWYDSTIVDQRNNKCTTDMK